MDLSTLLSMLLRGGGRQGGPMQPGFGAQGAGGDSFAPVPGVPGMGGGSWQDILASMFRPGVNPGQGPYGPDQIGGQPFGDDMIARQVPGDRQPSRPGAQPMPMPQRTPSRPNQLANKPGIMGGRPSPMRPGAGRQAPTRSPSPAGGRPMFDAWSRQTGNRQGLSYEDFQKPSQAGWFKDQWRNRNAG